MKALNEYSLIDIHYHAEPDLYLRRLNAIEAGKHYQAQDAAVVLKSHLCSTSVQASLCQSQGLPVLPSLVLNPVAGGIEPSVIIQALAAYKPLIKAHMIVHFPTITGRQFQSRLQRQLVYPSLRSELLQAETLFNEDSQLKKKAVDVLKMANDYPIVLSTGHASREETYQLIDACIKYNVRALLLNQPAHPLMGLKAQELKEIARHDFVWIEQTLLTYLLGHQNKEDLTEVLCDVPKVIYSSDLGQTNQMNVKAWFDFTEKLFTELKLSEKRKDEICRENALAMLTNH